MKKTLTTENGKKKSTAKKSAAKSMKGYKKATSTQSTRQIKFLVKKNGQLETKEERAKRLAKREALTLRAFQMAYDNYHRE